MKLILPSSIVQYAAKYNVDQTGWMILLKCELRRNMEEWKVHKSNCPLLSPGYPCPLNTTFLSGIPKFGTEAFMTSLLKNNRKRIDKIREPSVNFFPLVYLYGGGGRRGPAAAGRDNNHRNLFQRNQVVVPSIFFQSSSVLCQVQIKNFNHKILLKQFKPQLRNFTTTNMAQQSTPNGSLCRQNYHEECEANINKQINMELYASYVYLSMAYYFDREDVALPGFHKYFKQASDEEREHAEKLMKYQNKRGGRIVLQPISKPTRDEWSSPLEAVKAALELEKTVNQTLLDLHGIGTRNNDAHLADYLESEFLEEQVKSIKELAGHVTNLNRVGHGFGEYIYDKELHE